MTYSKAERRLLDEWQRDFPLDARPYARIAEALGVSEDDVIGMLDDLSQSGVVGRIGGVIAPHVIGASTLAAMAVPSDRLQAVAERVSARPEVNHNYEREHRLNLWFVVTACDREGVLRVLAEIEAETGIEVVDLPLEQAFHIDLGFPKQWS